MKKERKDNIVFYTSVVIILALFLWGILFAESFEIVANSVFSFFTDKFGWFYILAMTSFIMFAVWIGFFSKYGNLKLGKEDDEPEFSRLSWFAMLFSAGMGIGLVFYGVAEPASHFLAPAMGIEPASSAAADFAMQKSFTHWGLHPWANYSVLGLGLAYMHYRKGQPLLVSSLFSPLLGEEVSKHIIGRAIDILAIFATISGMATSLGLGTYQINSGLNHLFNIPETTSIQLAIVGVLTLIYIWTAVSGVEKGIAAISNINIVLVAILILGSFLVGPTVGILNNLVQSTGSYFQNLIGNSFDIGAFAPEGNNWHSGWTIYYWSWWISWAPFTGSFIARISKGRTIKEFIAGVLFVPMLISFLWFAIFGEIALKTDLVVLQEAIKNTSTTFFIVFEQVAFGRFLSIVAVLLLFTFFITSANSATFVLGMLSEHGNSEPTNPKKIVWGLLQAALALALMIGSVNGLQMLQNISVTAALPFSIIIVLAMVALVKAISKEKI